MTAEPVHAQTARIANVQTIWSRCPHCQELLYDKRFARDLGVCSGCGFHTRLSAPERIHQLLDEGSVTPLPAPVLAEDPLGFTDLRGYPERLAEARARTGLDEAVVCVAGTVSGRPVIAAVMDFRFLGGSLGEGVGERITLAAEEAERRRAPLLLVTASGGARMQEGTHALMQMVKTSQALARLDEAGVLTLSLITDPTYGGVAASFATLTDVILAEPGAHMGFAGPRVIKQTIRQELPPGFQTAEFMLARGLVDAVVPRALLRHTLSALLNVQSGGKRPLPRSDIRLIHDPGELPSRDPYETVRLARHSGRPTALDYIYDLMDDFVELHGDRVSGDGTAIVGGLGHLAGRPVIVLGHQKGHGTTERIARGFGMAMPEGYRKSARLMRLADKLGLPVLTLIDTPGAHPGAEAEERGQAWAIAQNIHLMSGLPVPIVAVVVGEGGSGGALGLGVADRVLALANAVYSVISPEGCAAILWRDPEAAPAAAAALRIDAAELLRHRIVDAVVPEPPGGAHVDPGQAAELLREAVISALAEVVDRPADDLVRERRERFRRYGAG